MSKKSDALAVARDITEVFEGRKPLRRIDWETHGTKSYPIISAYCPACATNTVRHSSARFCRGAVAPGAWPWSAPRVVCAEDRAHLHVTCEVCGWTGTVACKKDACEQKERGGCARRDGHRAGV